MYEVYFCWTDLDKADDRLEDDDVTFVFGW